MSIPIPVRRMLRYPNGVKANHRGAEWFRATGRSTMRSRVRSAANSPCQPHPESLKRLRKTTLQLSHDDLPLLQPTTSAARRPPRGRRPRRCTSSKPSGIGARPVARPERPGSASDRLVRSRPGATGATAAVAADTPGSGLGDAATTGSASTRDTIRKPCSSSGSVTALVSCSASGTAAPGPCSST